MPSESDDTPSTADDSAHLSEPDWARLDALRRRFLAADGETPRTVPDYWREPEDLAAYDAVLAERIGWKWDAVLDELVDLDWRPSAGPVVDWGCGTGIASRRFTDRFPTEQVLLFDRSPTAREFARARLHAERPECAVSAVANGTDLDAGVLLISHVLGELSDADAQALLAVVRRSRDVVWVEAGNHGIARRLSRVRDQLLEEYSVLAPCTHELPCQALASGNQHWCHFFASPPAGTFADPTWVRIGRKLRIDLRSLPYHFLVLRRRTDAEPAPTTPDSKARLVGRPTVRGKLARCFACSATGLEERTVFKSADPTTYRTLKKGGGRFL